MADTYTSASKARLIENATRSGTWGNTLNSEALELIDDMASGIEVINLGTSTTYAMAALSNGTDSESRAAYLKFIGTPASAVAVTVHASVANKQYRIDNQCGQALTFKYASGANVTIASAHNTTVWCDGTTVTDQVSPNCALLDTAVTVFTGSSNSPRDILLENTNSGATAVCEFGTINNAGRSLGMGVTSTGWSGVFVSGGPAGEQASINTFGNIPLVLGSNEKAAMILKDGKAIFQTNAIKLADESVTSNATLQDDDHLVISVLSAGVYRLEMYLVLTSASSTPGLKYQLTYSGTTADGRGVGNGFDNSVAVTTKINTAAGIGATATLAVTTGVTNEMSFAGYVELTTTGTFKLQWAQNTSNGSAVTIKKNSYLRLTPLA